MFHVGQFQKGETAMLVLSRKVGERIQIDGNIVLEVLDIRNGRIKVGILAPAEKKIRRFETVTETETQPILKLPMPLLNVS